MCHTAPRSDIVMLGTFSMWKLGTLQARALPFARELVRRGRSVTILTVPWDQPSESGVIDIISGVRVVNTRAVRLRDTGRAVLELVREVRALQPQVVHLMKPRGFGGLAAAALRRSFPVVVDSDDWEGDGGWNRLGAYDPLQRRLFDEQERRLLVSADVVTAASTLLESRARLLRRSHPPQTVVRLPNGLSPDWIRELSSRANSDRHLSDGTARVLLYSRFREFRQDWLPRFIAELRERSTRSADVVIVGESEVVGGGCSGVSYMGYVPRKILPGIIGDASVAVVPSDDSLVVRSRQSVKLLELMAGGCPVIGSDVGDVASTLDDAGVVVQGCDAGVFARAVCSLLEHPGRLRTMSSAGQERIRSAFSIPLLTPTIESAYDRAMRARQE